MAISLVGTPAQAFGAGSAATISAPATDNAAGNTLVVAVTFEDFAGTVTKVEDRAGNVFVPLTLRQHSVRLMFVQFFHCVDAKGQTGNVVTAFFSNASSDFRHITVTEWTSSDGTIVVDSASDSTVNVVSGTSVNTTPDPSATATDSNILLLAFGVWSPPNGMTNTVGSYTKITPTDDGLQVFYKIVSGEASVAFTATFTIDDVIGSGIILATKFVERTLLGLIALSGLAPTANIAGAQFELPDGDVSAQAGTNWRPFSGASFFPMIDEFPSDDADYVSNIMQSGDADVFEVSTANATDPLSSVGHYARYRISLDSGTLTVSVKQGANVIASWSHNGPVPLTTFLQTMNAAQADSITDYSDLRLHFNIANQ